MTPEPGPIWSDVICLNAARAEILLAVELSAVEQHLRKSRIVGDGRDQAAAARFPFRMRAPFLLRQTQDGIVRQRLRHARPFSARPAAQISCWSCRAGRKCALSETDNSDLPETISMTRPSTSVEWP